MTDGAIRFALPRGFTDARGVTHREGAMRLATARDEIRALADFRSHVWPEAFAGVVLSRVVMSLGTLSRIDPGLIQSLAEEDREFLAALYSRWNGYGARGEERGDGGRERT